MPTVRKTRRRKTGPNSWVNYGADGQMTSMSTKAGGVTSTVSTRGKGIKVTTGPKRGLSKEVKTYHHGDEVNQWTRKGRARRSSPVRGNAADDAIFFLIWMALRAVWWTICLPFRLLRK